MDSILGTVKLYLPIPLEETHFDETLIMHINSSISILREHGIGPSGGYSVSGSTDKWSDYISNMSKLQEAKEYICIDVKLRFDPPESSTLLKAMESRLSELGWRLNSTADYSY